MKLSDLNNKRVCILGFGREGKATLRAIQKYAPKAMIEIRDKDQVSADGFQVSGITLRAGDNYLSDLDQFDVIIKSPGIKPSSSLKPQASSLTNATQLFLDTIKGTGSIVIGVTGSKGKSTTASLIQAILAEAGKTSFLIGNIGDPALDHIDDAAEGTIFVFEMSSYQLMNVTVSPQIAVITSFFPEHLDYHGSVDAYRDAKTNITRFQTENDVVFFNEKNEGAKTIAKEGKGKKIGFTEEMSPVQINETKLLGAHNLSNIAAAASVARHVGIDDEVIRRAVKNFTPLPHRLQLVSEQDGIRWIDDSISTTPESAIAALDALGDDVETTILGGQDRGNDFTNLAKRMAQSNVKTVILLGESAERIGKITQGTKAADMTEVIAIAKRETPKGKTVLLSPASPSYDMFKNFEERGKMFLAAIAA